MGNSKIEWTEKTWNVITGCTKISPGCAHCYAERMAKRLRGRCGYPADGPFRVTLHPERLDEPLHWRKPCMIFVCSMGDLFHPDVWPFTLALVFDTIKRCPQHIFMVLTKRPEIALQHTDNSMLHDYFGMKNLWLGVTAENQEMADLRVPILLQIPAAVRFVSVEPMLGPVDLTIIRQTVAPGYFGDCLRWYHQPEHGKETPYPAISWVICGGESGPGARPMNPDWARGLRDQCAASGTPFFFKQMGSVAALRSTADRLLPKELRIPSETKGSRFLDGRIWDQIPGGATNV